MNITTSNVDHSSPMIETRPFVRFSGVGCGVEGCNCSPKRFLSVSNGKIVISIELDEEEFASLLAAGSRSVEVPNFEE